MSDNLPEQPKSDNIDILEIFSLIGRGIKSLFDFIVSIFESVFKLLILFALFIKRNIIILLAAVIIGFAVGFVSDLYQKTFFTSTMVVEPNFGTSTQLIDNIKLYSQLTKNNDSITLSQIFGITPSEAAKIMTIGIEAKSNINVKLKLYDEFVKDADTATLKNVTFEKFEQSLTTEDYKQFYIVMDAQDKSIFKKVESKILEIPLTDFIISLRKSELDNLTSKENGIRMSLQKIDSLRLDYKKIMLDEDKRLNKPASGGNTFYMGTENIRETNEIKLFEIERQYDYVLEEISIEKTQKQNFINVISGFQDIGIRVKKQNKFLYALIGLAFAGLFLILKEFNRFLKMQEIKMRENG